jgi:hypothetical protein
VVVMHSQSSEKANAMATAPRMVSTAADLPTKGEVWVTERPADISSEEID